MNVGLPGANEEPSPIHHAVVPFTGAPSSSTQGKAAPPHDWTSMPRWVLYQDCILAGSFALKNTPPMPVTRFINDLLQTLIAYSLRSTYFKMKSTCSTRRPLPCRFIVTARP